MINLTMNFSPINDYLDSTEFKQFILSKDVKKTGWKVEVLQQAVILVIADDYDYGQKACRFIPDTSVIFAYDPIDNELMKDLLRDVVITVSSMLRGMLRSLGYLKSNEHYTITHINDVTLTLLIEHW